MKFTDKQKKTLVLKERKKKEKNITKIKTIFFCMLTEKEGWEKREHINR